MPTVSSLKEIVMNEARITTGFDSPPPNINLLNTPAAAVNPARLAAMRAVPTMSISPEIPSFTGQRLQPYRDSFEGRPAVQIGTLHIAPHIAVILSIKSELARADGRVQYWLQVDLKSDQPITGIPRDLAQFDFFEENFLFVDFVAGIPADIPAFDLGMEALAVLLDME